MKRKADSIWRRSTCRAVWRMWCSAAGAFVDHDEEADRVPSGAGRRGKAEARHVETQLEPIAAALAYEQR